MAIVSSGSSTGETASSISGQVTAQNDFGAEKTLRYRCSISDGTVTDVTVNEV